MARQINLIVVHCSDSPNGRKDTVDDIDRWHNERGFRRAHHWMVKFNPDIISCGYHYVIPVSGFLETARHRDEMGAHAAGHNSKSIGICMIGRDKFTSAQWATLKKLYDDLHGEYPDAKWIGHRDISEKSCPGFSVQKWLENNCIPDPKNVL